MSKPFGVTRELSFEGIKLSPSMAKDTCASALRGTAVFVRSTYPDLTRTLETFGH
jgi:hypothetical protein